MNDKKEPQTWRDMVAAGIEEMRASVIETAHQLATGEQIKEDRLEYQDIPSIFDTGSKTEKQNELDQGEDLGR